MRKSILASAVILLVMIFSSVQAQSPIDKVYEKYSGQEGITAINFSKEMFQMLQQMKVSDSAGGDLKDVQGIVNQLSGLKVLMYSFDSAQIVKAVSMYNEFAGAFPASQYKELMTIQEGRQFVKFMTKQESSGKVSEFVMLLKDKDEVGVISLTGNIDLASISNMSKFMNIKGMDNLKKMKEKGGH